MRHAITKLSHIHFPASEESRRRIISMGEDPEYVFNVGCPGMDLIKETNLSCNAKFLRQQKGIERKSILRMIILSF